MSPILDEPNQDLDHWSVNSNGTATPVAMEPPVFQSESPAMVLEPYDPDDWVPLDLTDEISISSNNSPLEASTEPTSHELARRARHDEYERRRAEVDEKVRKIIESKVVVPEALRFCGETPPIGDFQYNKYLRDYIYVPEWMEGSGPKSPDPWDGEDSDFSM